MFDCEFWLMFAGVAVALNVAPGPDVLYILTKTISGGRKVGFASSLGVCTGALFHVFLAAVGISAILMTSELAFAVVKYIGAAYLLYLAVQAFRSTGRGLDVMAGGARKESAWAAFRQGVLIDILNPKVAIFFMAFLPQFLREGYGSTSSQLIHLGIVVILIAIVVEGLYVLAADKIAGKFRQDRRYGIWLERVVGTVFVGLGVKLAVSTNT